MRVTEALMRSSVISLRATASLTPLMAAFFDHVHAGLDRLQRRRGRIVACGNARHIHCIGDDQSAEFQFVAQNAGENFIGERCWFCNFRRSSLCLRSELCRRLFIGVELAQRRNGVGFDLRQ
jgi:hypothetical protein